MSIHSKFSNQSAKPGRATVGRGLAVAFVASMIFAFAVSSGSALASAPIYIWKSERIGYHDGYYFPVSIGKPSNPTPTGKFTVKKKQVDYVSNKYKLPMPYSVFFTDAHAIHSGDISTESRGCVRVPREWAVWLYSKAKSGKTKVIVKP